MIAPLQPSAEVSAMLDPKWVVESIDQGYALHSTTPLTVEQAKLLHSLVIGAYEKSTGQTISSHSRLPIMLVPAGSDRVGEGTWKVEITRADEATKNTLVQLRLPNISEVSSQVGIA